jgi:hypothetical protein
MGFFHDRIETSTETTIRYSKAAVFYYLMWAMLASGWLAWVYGGALYIVFLLVFGVMMVFAVPFWSTNAEIKRAMKSGAVAGRGSKYSFSNPLTFVINKDQHLKPKAGQPFDRIPPLE